MYLRSALDGEAAPVLTSIQVGMQGRVRSHFERMVLTPRVPVQTQHTSNVDPLGNVASGHSDAFTQSNASQSHIDAPQQNLPPREDSFETQPEDSDAEAFSDSSNNSECSDFDDYINMKAAKMEELSEEYQGSDRCRWLLAVQEVSQQLRDDVLLPSQTSRDECDSGVLLPRWHCAFIGCRASSLNDKGDVNHERGLWQHIWSEHRRFMFHIVFSKSHREGTRLCSTSWH